MRGGSSRCCLCRMAEMGAKCFGTCGAVSRSAPGVETALTLRSVLGCTRCGEPFARPSASAGVSASLQGSTALAALRLLSSVPQRRV